jgi:hypothetical protein
VPTAHAALSALLTAVVGLTLTGCGESNDPDPRPTPPETSRGEAQQRDATGGMSPSTHQETPVRIQITVGDQRFHATLSDSAAGRDLIAQLPVTINMIDHGSVEKTGPLPSPLSLDGQPEGADPDPGDLGYYAPGHDLVLYYGDQSSFPGIVILGRLDDGAAERIATLDGSVTAVVEATQR